MDWTIDTVVEIRKATKIGRSTLRAQTIVNIWAFLPNNKVSIGTKYGTIIVDRSELRKVGPPSDPSCR